MDSKIADHDKDLNETYNLEMDEDCGMMDEDTQISAVASNLTQTFIGDGDPDSNTIMNTTSDSVPFQTACETQSEMENFLTANEESIRDQTLALQSMALAMAEAGSGRRIGGGCEAPENEDKVQFEIKLQDATKVYDETPGQDEVTLTMDPAQTCGKVRTSYKSKIPVRPGSNIMDRHKQRLYYGWNSLSQHNTSTPIPNLVHVPKLSIELGGGNKY